MDCALIAMPGDCACSVCPGIKMTEVAYTSIARLAAAAGNGDEALSAARKVVGQGLAPRLRTFVPALMAFAASGQVLRCLPLPQGPGCR